MAPIIITKFKHWIRWVLIGLFVLCAPTKTSADELASRAHVVDQALDRYEQRSTVRKRITHQQTSDEHSTYEFKPFEYASGAGIKPLKHFSAPGSSGKIHVSGGVRKDRFNWNIAGDITGANPNISQEQEYSNVRSAQVHVDGELVLRDHWVFDGKMAFGSIYEGSSRESEYLSDDRQFEFTRIDAKIKDNSTLDSSVGAGLRFKIEDTHAYEVIYDMMNYRELVLLNDLWITGLAGYAWDKQKFEITDGVQSVDTFDLFGLGPFPGLKNQYESTWRGHWFGVELYKKYERLWSSFRFEYHFADYEAEADLNLRPDVNHPKSFKHNAEGRGLIYRAGLGYFLNDNWSVGLDLEWQNWLAEDGKDRLFLANGTIPETKLNEVEWQSFALLLGTTIFFE